MHIRAIYPTAAWLQLPRIDLNFKVQPNFVEVSTTPSNNKACESRHFTQRSRALPIMGSREQPAALLEGRRIYLGNLLYVVRPVEIEDTLKDNDFGNFEKIVISVDPVNGRNPGYCFVDFVERADAERALSSLCIDIRGRPVKVGPCEPKKQRQRQEPGVEGTGDSPYEAMGHFDKVVGTDGDGRRLYIGGLTRMIDQQQAQEEMRDILAGFNP
ncbi:hypothetical protein Brms1b_010518 [Colletotrichum noveboracense]|nr:hypothetical protein Brms1b_010518 [Colletotrichum noveboracense]